MIIGVSKEIKNNENRVGLTPAGAEALVKAGHKVLVETGSGLGSGFADEDYTAVGAELISDKKQLFDKSEMIVKVKEPLPSEYDLFHEGQLLFTYLHLAAEPELTEALLKHKVTSVAYETVVGRDGRSLPLLAPMSEIAGRMSVQIGAQFLESRYGGAGVLLGGVSGVAPAQVVIIGGGVVGTNAAKMAVGLGARVTIIDLSIERLRYLDDVFGGRVATVSSNSYNIAQWVREADLLIGAVLVPGAKTPQLVTEDMIKTMKQGSVVVDVAIDQGGSIATCDHVTTHENPTFVKHGVLHYSVANIPGAVARTSTLALTNATLPYALTLAGKGWREACRQDAGLAQGLNTVDGKITNQPVSEALGLEYVDKAVYLES
ncbi:MAG: alanine dehydrogenase [Selenomonas ruminantium]|jgi:alanine dehydrogenase|uniref:Alanine dehydrogenase n=1 Tax=Selenomonas ruminantium TaxID=971 RepID=A0A927WM18_SELRU|nr:alanine dehydrogenase [Selenomonas ruminantium]MBE6084775.1 alanine dehydrogenase [Selenomonas ruminantium]